MLGIVQCRVYAGMPRSSFPGAELIIEGRFAEEKWKSQFNKNTKENYPEMGLLSLSVVFYTLKDGEQAVDMLMSSHGLWGLKNAKSVPMSRPAEVSTKDRHRRRHRPTTTSVD